MIHHFMHYLGLLNPLHMLKDILRKTYMYRLFRGNQNINYADLLLLHLNRIIRPGTLSVAWLLCGDESVGSSRIHGIDISNYLKSNGVNSCVIQKFKGYCEYPVLDERAVDMLINARPDVVIFQRIYKGTAAKIAKELSVSRIKTVFLMADIFQTDMPFVCDHTIVMSESLKEQLVKVGVRESSVSVIPDPVETDYSTVKSYDDERREGIKVVWVGAEANWSSLEVIESALRDASLRDYKLITISNHPSATFVWDFRTVWDQILDCDIAVIPIDMSRKESLVKSNNRLTMFKALGLPVICSPLLSYLGIVNHDESGYFATTRDEWLCYLQLLRDPLRRQSIGLAGRDKIFEQYGIETIGRRYLTLFSKIAGKGDISEI